MNKFWNYSTNFKYISFKKFLEENGFISAKNRVEMVKIHKNNLFLHIDKNVMDVKEATVSEVFINTLADLINSGAVKIHTVTKDVDSIHDFHEEYVGFDDGNKDCLYFFGVPVWNAVNKAAGSGKGLMNSKESLMGELVKRGIMVPHIKGDGTKTNTFNKELYGKTQGTWRILKSALGYDDRDVLDKYVNNEEEEVTEEEMAEW